MSGDHPIRADGGQFCDRTGDNRLKEPAGEVETTDEGMDLAHSGDPLGVANDVDGPRVAAAGQHDQPFASNVDDHRLVVPDPGVRLPSIVSAGLLAGEALLEVSHPLGLPAHEHRLIEEQRRSSFLDDFDALCGEVGSARRGHVDLRAGREDDAPIPPRVGVQHEGHARLPESPEHPLQTGVVVGVAVGEHNRAKVGGSNVEDVHVPDGGVTAETGVVEDRLCMPAPAHRQEQGEAVLGAELVPEGPLVDERRSVCDVSASHQDVDEGVNKHCDFGDIHGH